MYCVAVLAKLDFTTVPHNKGHVYIFREEEQFSGPVQPGARW